MAMPYPLPHQIFQMRPRQNTNGHMMVTKAMQLPTDGFIHGMPRLTAGVYAPPDGICQPMPNGQRLQIIWEARALRVVSSRKLEQLTGIAPTHPLTTAAVSQRVRVVTAATTVLHS